jgi:PII-like signaling protein
MAITIGTADFPTLTAQPFGYEETETRAGQTARKWLVTGLLRPSEWLSLLDAYDDWRGARIEDEPTETSGVIGTTISFTGGGPGGQAWAGVDCWFITAPAAEQLGAYLSVTVELVDANEALQVLIKIKEQEEAEGTLSYGAVTIGSSSFPNLTVQPFGYEETDTKAGYTAKKWTITGLLTPAEWLSLLDAYDEWRDARIQDEPSEISEIVGTTIAFSGTGPGGQTWSSVACWFTAAPTAEQSEDTLSDNLSATVELVDANEALEVLLKEKEQEAAADNEVLDYGPVTIGSASFPNLTAQPFGYDETDTKAGRTAKKWTITGTLTSGEWSSLLNAYDGWRDARIEDEPSEVSEVVGTTIALSGTGIGGGASCWFTAAPTAEQSGDVFSATVGLVDASEALQVLLKERDEGAANEILDYGPVTIGSASFPNLTAQPFGYDETDTKAGLTAKKWRITGTLTSGEWSSLLGAYDGWRDARIQDEPSEISEDVGTTIALSGTGISGGGACWFTTAPTAEQSGDVFSATVELVDASEALAVLLKARQNDEAVAETLPNLGTFTIGGAVLKLLKPAEGYAETPTLQLTATGTHYIQGARVPYSIRDIEGTTDSAGWANVLGWYAAQVATVPAAGSYFPITAPSASAANKIVDGVTVIEYTVSIQLGVVL